MVTQIWVNSGSSDGFLPEGTKPLPEPMLTYYQGVLWHSFESNFTASAHELYLLHVLRDYASKITTTSTIDWPLS